MVNSNSTVDELRQSVHNSAREYDDYTTPPSDIWFGDCRATRGGECGDMRITDESFMGLYVSQHRRIIAYVHPLNPPTTQQAWSNLLAAQNEGSSSNSASSSRPDSPIPTTLAAPEVADAATPQAVDPAPDKFPSCPHSPALTCPPESAAPQRKSYFLQCDGMFTDKIIESVLPRCAPKNDLEALAMCRVLNDFRENNSVLSPPAQNLPLPPRSTSSPVWGLPSTEVGKRLRGWSGLAEEIRKRTREIDDLIESHTSKDTDE